MQGWPMILASSRMATCLVLGQQLRERLRSKNTVRNLTILFGENMPTKKVDNRAFLQCTCRSACIRKHRISTT
jgi:hypothetical protein